jgi:hypothetical protein
MPFSRRHRQQGASHATPREHCSPGWRWPCIAERCRTGDHILTTKKKLMASENMLVFVKQLEVNLDAERINSEVIYFFVPIE